MIQRIQTVYLLLASVIGALFFFFPIVSVMGESAFSLELMVKNNYISNTPFLLLAILFVGLNVVSIFLFGNRKRQMLLVRFGIYSVISFVLLAAINIYRLYQLVGAEVKIGWVVYAALLAIVFNVLAFRGVKKDEDLIRAADRIR
jgi:Co/Zn/Cd efflux system component